MQHLSIYCIIQPQVNQLYATPIHLLYNTTTGHPAICNTWTSLLLYTTTTGHPAIFNTWTSLLLYTTTTGHPAICNTWTSIYIVYYNHRSSSHMQLLDIYLSYATTTCHPATCISIVIQLYYYHRPSIYLQCIYYPTTSSMFDHPTTYNIQPIFRVVLIYHFYTWSTDPKSQNSRNLLSIPTSCESAIIDRSSIHKRCCYKTVDFATAASQNGICITQGNCHETI
jgi:hypothetical protein